MEGQKCVFKCSPICVDMVSKSGGYTGFSKEEASKKNRVWRVGVVLKESEWHPAGFKCWCFGP